MSIFDDAEDLMAGALGVHFGDDVLVFPMVSNGIVVGSADPARATYTVRAVIDIRSNSERAEGDNTRNGKTPDLMSPAITLAIERELVVWPYLLPKEGDEIQTIAKPTKPAMRYRITAKAPLGGSFANYVLIPIPVEP